MQLLLNNVSEFLNLVVKGTSINKVFDIDVTVYSNLDVVVRLCIKFSLIANAKKRIYLKNRLRNGSVKFSAK